jgi:tRNA(Ile)-lysidine synthase
MRSNNFITKEVIGSLTSLTDLGETLVVAVSGGIDSVTLLHFLKKEAGAIGVKLHAVHVNHCLRGDASFRDAKFVEDLCKTLGVECTIHKIRVETNGDGIEAAARDARYAALEETAVKLGATYIAVAHNADDVAESLLMNLARGSGVRGLGSHVKTRPCGNAMIVRPLHGVTRAEIEEWVKWQFPRIEWVEDETNKDLAFLRNRVRHELMPVLKKVFGDGITLSVCRSSDLMREAADFIDACNEDMCLNVVDVDNTCVSIDIKKLAGFDRRVINDFLRHATRSLTERPISYTDTKRISRLVNAETGKKETLSQGLIAVRRKHVITVSKIDRSENLSLDPN